MASFKTHALTDGDFPINPAQSLKTIRDLQKPLGASEERRSTPSAGDGDNDKALKKVLRTIAKGGGSFMKKPIFETGSGAAACKICGWCASTPTLHQSPA